MAANKQLCSQGSDRQVRLLAMCDGSSDMQDTDQSADCIQPCGNVWECGIADSRKQIADPEPWLVPHSTG